MIKNKIKRSPLFYVGDKYKLMEQLIELFPLKVNHFYEPFVGGGTVFLNVKAKKYFLNDIDTNLIRLHNTLISYSDKNDQFFVEIEKIITKYNLSRSYKEDIIPTTIKKLWKKTYYARFNKKGYTDLRNYFNNQKKELPLELYTLLIYGFNRMLRFNRSGDFNLPVGNVDFNKNVVNALKDYFETVKNKKIKLSDVDFRRFFNLKFQKDDFVYVDPPYLITFSEYNKFWNDDSEKDLLKNLDELNNKGVKFALSNVTHYKGKKNNVLIEWMKKYNVYCIKSNYISYHNNSNKEIKEVLITNYL
ncbi:MAG: Dam family site-specific DNA-(adenine-N6)-methyltransferase [Candidatus Paceibacterota bacterium]|jgi:DNA adenine methylase